MKMKKHHRIKGTINIKNDLKINKDLERKKYSKRRKISKLLLLFFFKMKIRRRGKKKLEGDLKLLG
jgi:hypothetical protein